MYGRKEGNMKRKKGIILAGLSAVAGFATGTVVFNKLYSMSGAAAKKKIERLTGYYALLNQWLQLRQIGITLEQYFLNCSYHNIAVYGMGELGVRLCEELRDSEVNIKFALDKNKDNLYTDLEVFSLEDCPQDEIDAIVVTPVFAYGEIEKELSGYVNCPIVSLEDVVFGI